MKQFWILLSFIPHMLLAQQQVAQNPQAQRPQPSTPNPVQQKAVTPQAPTTNNRAIIPNNQPKVVQPVKQNTTVTNNTIKPKTSTTPILNTKPIKPKDLPAPKVIPAPINQSKIDTNVEKPKNDGALDSYFNEGATSTPIGNAPTPEIPSAWGPFFFLTFLIVGIYLVIRFIKKKMLQLKITNNPVSFIRTVASIPVTGSSQLAIVDIAGKFFLFGITSHSMEMIMEIKDFDLIMKIQSIPAEGNAKSFKEIFLELFGSRNTKKISSPKTEDDLKRFIESQKNRMGNMK